MSKYEPINTWEEKQYEITKAEIINPVLEKIKEEINNGYPTSVEDIIWIIDNHLLELKGSDEKWNMGFMKN